MKKKQTKHFTPKPAYLHSLFDLTACGQYATTKPLIYTDAIKTTYRRKDVTCKACRRTHIFRKLI